MEAVTTIGAYGPSIVNKPLQHKLKDEVKIAFDNATGNEIFFRKYKVETSAEGNVWCIVKKCKSNLKDINQLQSHCPRTHGISFSVRGEFILNIELKQREIEVFDMSGKDARNITNSPKSVSISNDCVKVAGIIGESSSSIADNDLQDLLKDEVINAFKNYKDDNHYGSKYKIAIVDNKYECIIKGCKLSYKDPTSLPYHCLHVHNIKIVITGSYIIAIEKLILKEPPVCRECEKKLNNLGSLRRHYSRVHHLKCKFEDGLLLPIMKTSNESSKIDKPDTGKIQDNTNATNTTTNNMDSNRKRSYFSDRYYEKSNAKKAMLNPSESGYPQSDSFISISSSLDNGILSITEYNSVDDTLATGNNDLITTDVQPSTTSENIDDDQELLELARELAENNSDFQDALNKDVADKYATSRVSYLQFPVTSKKYK